MDNKCVPTKVKFRHNRMITANHVMVRGKRCRVLEWGKGECVALVPVDLLNEK